MNIPIIILFYIISFTNSIEIKIKESINDYSFLNDVISGFSLIFFSELLDRTFFLNMLYGLTHSFLKTFFISSTTLLTLNVLALTLGRSLPFFLYRKWIDWIAVFIYFFFGIILLHDSYNYDYEAYTFQSELSNPLIENREESQMTTTKSTISNLDQHTYDTSLSFITSLVLAECGDKSQITSIVIGAIYDFKPVLLGTSLALLSCIILAVFIGNYISQKINKRQINLISGIVFTLFGISYLIQLLI